MSALLIRLRASLAHLLAGAALRERDQLLEQLAAERARVAALELQAKDGERCVVNLVAALRQANARCIHLEEMIIELTRPDAVRRCGRPVPLDTEIWH